MCVCMYAHVCACVCVSVHVCVRMYVCKWECAFVNMRHASGVQSQLGFIKRTNPYA